MPDNTRPIYVFDHVRSNSQLFNKLFAVHPQLEQIFMPLIAASLVGPEAIFRGRKHNDVTEETFMSLAEGAGVAETESYAVAVDRIESAVNTMRDKGKIPWLKDHAFCVVPRTVQDAWRDCKPLSEAIQRNPTVLSTEFLDSVTPIFLIRHPALNIPSFFRKNITICRNQADDEDFVIYSALFWSRLLLDSFVLRGCVDIAGEENGRTPIVLDAADVIYNTEATIQSLCCRLGIDASGGQYSWDPLPKREWPDNPVMCSFFDSLYRSSGLERRADKPAEDDMDVEMEQQAWTEEFGSERAQILRGLVDKELEHYEYLRSFKLRV